MPQSPPTLRGATAVQAAEAVVVLAASILAGVDAASGRSYHVNSGIALTVIGLLAAAALAWVALGLFRARRWSRTPALLTQLFFGIVGIYLLQSHRLDWGIVSVVFAVAGFALLLAPPSMRALTGGQAAAGDQQAPTGDKQAAGGRKPPAPGPKPPAAGRKPPASAPGRKQPAGRKQPTAGGKQPTAGGKQPTAGGKQPTPAPGRKRPAR